MNGKFLSRRGGGKKRSSTTGKLIATIAVLGAAASIAGLGTYATFTSTTSQSHTIASGTVTGRYKPVRGSNPRTSRPTSAPVRASPAATDASDCEERRSAARALLRSLEIPAGICAGYLLVAARCVPVNA